MADSDALVRFGDPGASRFRIAPWTVVVVIFVGGLAISGGTALMVRAIQTQDRVHILGSEIGIGFATFLILTVAVGVALLGRPVSRAVRVARVRHPTALIIGARVPNLGSDLRFEIWPTPWQPVLGPQQLALCVDETGIEFIGANTAGETLLSLTWDQVTGISPCEYVEHRVAYEGLAIEAAAPGTAAVIQVMKPGLPPRFPRGRALADIAAQAGARRSW